MADDLGGAVIGSLTVLIGADVAGLLAGVNESRQALSEFRDESTLSAGAVTALATAVAAAAVTFTAEFVKSSMDTINSQYLLAQQLGGTTTAVQVLDRAAQMSGSSSDALEAAARRLNATLGQVQEQGAGKAYDALQKLGLSAADLSKMDLDQRFLAIGQRMEALGYSTQQESAFLKDMGLRGQGIIGVFQNGGDVIKQAKDQVDSFGIAVNDVDASKVHEAKEAFDSIGVALTGIGNEIVVDIAPYIVDIGKDFTDSAGKADGFKTTVQGTVDSIVRGVGNIGDAIQIVQTGVDGVELIVMDVGEFIGRFILGVLEDVNSLVSALTKVGEWAGNTVPGLQAVAQGASSIQGAMDSAISNMQGKVDSGAADITAKGNEIVGFFSKPWPSENADKWISDVKAGLDTAGTSADDLYKKINALLGDDGSGGSTGPTDAQKKAAAAAQKVLDGQLKTLQTSLQASEQSEQTSYDKQLSELNTFLQKKMITQSQYDDLFSRLEQDHADKLAQIQANEFQEATKNQFATINMITNTLDAIGSAIQASGEDQFGIAKAFSVATALLKGYESITSSYAAGAAIGGPFLGAVFAGLAAAATAAQISSLMSVTSSSSGTPSVSGSSSTSAAAAPAAAQSPGQTLTLSGIDPNQLFSGTMVRSLVSQLVQFQKDGGTLVVVK